MMGGQTGDDNFQPFRMNHFGHCQLAHSISIREGRFTIPDSILESGGQGLLVHMHRVKLHAQPFCRAPCDIFQPARVTRSYVVEDDLNTNRIHQCRCLYRIRQ